MKKRGFASMSKDQLLEITSRGGKAAHEKGTAHTWNKKEAKAAALKGVAARKKQKCSHSMPVKN